MPSTLHMFRKHQKVLMVMTTGLAMISFVVLGAVNSRPEEMPAPLVVVALAAMFGGAAWVIGQVNGKSSEYFTFGAVLGAVLGLWLSWGKQEPIAVYTDSGNITKKEVFVMKQHRNLANSFVREAYQRVNGFNVGLAEQFGMRVLFRYTPQDDDNDVDMAITELLQREADRMGIAVSTAGVFEYIRSLSMSSTKSLTQEQFAEIRAKLGVSEDDLIAVLADELRARKVFELLYSQRPSPTPEAFFEYYSKLNVQQEAEVAVLPVADFIDAKAEPTKQELEDLFAKYQSGQPGFGPDGKFVEGLPGFRQPPRVKMAYLEAVSDTFEKQAGEVTDAEIEKRYEELKTRPLSDLPDLPGLGGNIPPMPPSGAATTPETPPSDKTAAPAAPPVDAAKPETPAPMTPAAPLPEAAKPEASTPPPATTPEPSAPPAAPPEKPSTALPNLSKLSFVSFQDEPPPPPTATTDAAPATAPAATTPPAAKAPLAPPTIPPAGAPATSVPGLPPAPPGAEDAKSADPPLPTVRPLDDAYRAEIKQEIIRERTQVLLDKKIEAAAQYVAEEVGALINTPPEEKGHINAEEATKKLKAYAEKNGLVYVETDWQSYDELQDSEDYPIGAAEAVNHPQRAKVAQDVFESYGRSMRYMPRPAAAFDIDGGSRFVYWLSEERPGGVPPNMDDPIVKQQVVRTWRELKARGKAEERATALMKLAKEAGKPLTEALGNLPVTGVAETNILTVRPTGKFSWYSAPVVPPTGMNREAPVTLTTIPALKPLGDEFMSTVFEKLKPGEMGVASSVDKSEYYLVRIVSRTPSTPEELEAFRQKFLARGLVNEYQELAGRDWSLYGRNPLDELLKRHNVQIVGRETSNSED